MTETLVVALGTTVAGTLTREPRGLRFDYDDAYRQRPGATPLSVSMPLQVRTHRAGKITSWLWGLLPDRADVLGRWSREFQTTSSSPFALLASPVGEDCAGAVRFLHPGRVATMLDRPGSIEWLSEQEVAARLAALRHDPTAWLGADSTGQFSLAGAQAKTALHFDGERWGLPSGAAPTTHILKPAITGLDDHDLNEHLCLDAARRAGLTVARTRIATFADQTALVIERYDRHRVGPRITRVHQEDLCQALGVAPDGKYQTDGGPGVRDIASILRATITPAPAAAAAVDRLLDALAWNWVIGGTDAHAKNYALLLSGHQVRLAPLYDIASVLPYPGVDELKLKMAMKLGGEYRLKAHGPPTWPNVAAELGLDAAPAVARVTRLVASAPDLLRDAAGTPEVKRLRSPLPRRLVDAVAARSKRCLRQLPPVSDP